MNMVDTPHVVLSLFGNFKGEQDIPRCYLRRVVIESKSGLNISPWVRHVSSYEMNNNTKYFNDRMKQKAGVYKEYLFRKLESVQKEEEGVMAKGIKVREAYVISCSFRRGSTTEATNGDNKECSDTDIERNSRWRSENKVDTKQAGLDMLQIY